MYFDGAVVVEPMSAMICIVLVDSMGYSQFSMNSHKCKRLLSVDSGTRLMSETMQFTMECLKPKFPSS
jgi:hypothetical protein